jgi:hypothetical protein
MPFKMILAEGTFNYGGGMSGDPPLNISMQPVWVSFSERNNVLFYKNLVTSGDPTNNDILGDSKSDGFIFNLAEIWKDCIQKNKDQENNNNKDQENNNNKDQENNNDKNQENNDQENNEDGDQEANEDEDQEDNDDEDQEDEDQEDNDDEDDEYFSRNMANYKKFMKIEDSTSIEINVTAFDGNPIEKNIIDVFVDEDELYESRETRIYSLFCYTNEKNAKIIERIIDYDGLLFDDEGKTKFNLYKSGEIKDIQLETENYVIDSNNNLAILPKHFPKIIDKIRSINLVNQVISKLNKINFNLPQIKDDFEHTFCNESVYANLGFVTVYGFMKMQHKS